MIEITRNRSPGEQHRRYTQKQKQQTGGIPNKTTLTTTSKTGRRAKDGISHGRQNVATSKENKSQ
jgi:hypothetical protein